MQAPCTAGSEPLSSSNEEQPKWRFETSHKASGLSGLSAAGSTEVSLEVFKTCGEVALRDRHGGGVFMVGLGDLSDIFQA